MNELKFTIKGMDCVEEVAILKREIGPLVGGEMNLHFDLLDSRMTVRPSSESTLDAGKVIEAVSRTGMQATPWSQPKSLEGTKVGKAGWRKRDQLLFCMASGVCLLLGFLLHLAIHKSLVDALTSEGSTPGHAFPLGTSILYGVAVVAGSWHILPKAWRSVLRLRPDMNLLMVVAVLGAIGIGEWFEAATVSFLFSLAIVLESWSVGKARHAIKSLIDASPVRARTFDPVSGVVVETAVDEIPVGATVLVRPGEKVPLDGLITCGETSINQAPITGESMPVPKRMGDEVFAGTLNQDGAFEFQVTKPADDTTLSRVIRLVQETQSNRSPSEQWVERFAVFYTPAMMTLAILFAVLPPLVTGGSWAKWFYEGLVLLVIACPCALVISTPVSMVAAIAAATRSGILVKGGAFLEAAAQLKAIALDKTGTLTYGHPEVQRIVPLNGHTELEVLSRAAALEANSIHPLSRAILAKAVLEGIPVDPASDLTAVPGKGAKGTIHGQLFWIGSHRFVEEMGSEEEGFHDLAVNLENAGHSLVAVGNDKHICGVISVSDLVREEAAEVIQAIKHLGVVRVVMLTGDNRRTAESVALVSGVDEARAELLPEDKVNAVKELREKYSTVAMVGDGVNDAPAMGVATLGIAMGAIGSDVAIEAADIALMSDNLRKIPWLIGHSRRTLRTIKQNVVFSLGIKLVFVLLAFSGQATLWMAIAADMGASLAVIFNGLRLLNGKRKD